MLSSDILALVSFECGLSTVDRLEDITMKYVTALFKYAAYFPTIGFFIGLAWGFTKTNSSQTGSMGLVMSMAIGGAIGLIVGVALRFFAGYVMGAQSHPGLY